METLAHIVILLAYLSLLVELTVLHVPSVASSRGIWIADDRLVAGYSARYRRLFFLGRATKLVLFFVPVLISCATFAYPLLALALGGDPIGDYLYAPTPASWAAAAVLVAAGRAVTLVSVVTIRRENEQVGDSFRLHRAGVFRWSRNPGLLGMYLFVLGTWVAVPSAAMLLGMLLYFGNMHFRIRMEEDFLANRFGDRYDEYRLQTRRYLL